MASRWPRPGARLLDRIELAQLAQRPAGALGRAWARAVRPRRPCARPRLRRGCTVKVPHLVAPPRPPRTRCSACWADRRPTLWLRFRRPARHAARAVTGAVAARRWPPQPASSVGLELKDGVCPVERRPLAADQGRRRAPRASRRRHGPAHHARARRALRAPAGPPCCAARAC